MEHETTSLYAAGGADRCEECGFVWEAPLLDHIRVVSRFPDRVYELIEGLEGVAYQRPKPDVWSPNEYVWHVADVFSIFSEWLHIIRTHDHPTYATIDGDALANVRGYAERPIDTGAWALWNAVATFVQEAASADPERLVLCKGWREVSAAEVIAFAAHEATHHASDLERMLPGEPESEAEPN